MSIKAIHMEVVTDLTSEAFFAAPTRFISRRGLNSHLCSDNATNFVGAERQLIRDFQKKIQEDASQNFLAEHLITFHFIYPRARYFGGLWEKAIQSAKKHFRRVIGNQILILEEFSTLVCRVEAMLNSRPLTPLSADPSEYIALTRRHFLVNGPLIFLPKLDRTEVPQNRLKRWLLVQALEQQI